MNIGEVNGEHRRGERWISKRRAWPETTSKNRHRKQPPCLPLYVQGVFWETFHPQISARTSRLFSDVAQYNRPGVGPFMVSLRLSKPKTIVLAAHRLDNNVRLIAVYQSAFLQMPHPGRTKSDGTRLYVLYSQQRV